MKRLLFVLSLLIAWPCYADDAVTSFGWNSVTGTFQAMTRALGWKNVPDTNTAVYTSGLTWSGVSAPPTTYALRFSRVGKNVTVDLNFTSVTLSGTTLIGITGFASEFKTVGVSKWAPLAVLSNATNGIATCDMDADGHLYIGSSGTGANWTTGTVTNTGGVNTTCSWNIQ
jgi:hypothetical protein